jgi:hypothetical protein
MNANSKGNCYLCCATVGKTAIKNHLIKHYGEDNSGQECYLLKAEGTFNKEYWLYFDVPIVETLSCIDSFLRKIWLECCGHMSAFFITERFEVGMKQKLMTFDAGTKLFHHYDFGSTTETDVTFIKVVKRNQQKKAVRLLARNIAPVFQCADCGETADYVNTEFMYQSENPYYCEKCSEDYDLDMMLPVTNSPRMGECGYTGEDDDTFTFNPASFISGKG